MSDTGAAAATAATGDTTGQQAAAADAAAQAATDTAAAAAAGQQGEQQPTGDQAQQQANAEPWNDPAAARAEIERLRKQNGDDRVNAKNAARDEGKTEAQTALAKALAPLLGIELPDEQQATPEQLAEQVANVTGERDAAVTEAAVVRTAYELGVDPTKLDYLAFKLGKGEKLDPSAADFSGKLKASITALMAADATLKRPGAVAASGVENLAGSGGGDAITAEKFATMTLAEKQNLYKTDRATYDRLTGN